MESRIKLTRSLYLCFSFLSLGCLLFYPRLNHAMEKGKQQLSVEDLKKALEQIEKEKKEKQAKEKQPEVSIPNFPGIRNEITFEGEPEIPVIPRDDGEEYYKSLSSKDPSSLIEYERGYVNGFEKGAALASARSSTEADRKALWKECIDKLRKAVKYYQRNPLPDAEQELQNGFLHGYRDGCLLRSGYKTEGGQK